MHRVEIQSNSETIEFLPVPFSFIILLDFLFTTENITQLYMHGFRNQHEKHSAKFQ